jgi:predicted PurR-regulated permease PerM
MRGCGDYWPSLPTTSQHWLQYWVGAPTIIALLDHDIVTAVIVVVVYCVLNFVIQTIIQPRVVGVTVGLSATLSFYP